MNEVFLSLMFAANYAVMLVIVVKARETRRRSREARAAERNAKAWHSAARAEADRCEYTAGRCREMEISTKSAAYVAASAGGAMPEAPATYAAPPPKPNPNGLHIYNPTEIDYGPPEYGGSD